MEQPSGHARRASEGEQQLSIQHPLWTRADRERAAQGVGRRGLEPRTYGLKVHSSAIELAARDHRVPVGRDSTFAAYASVAFMQVSALGRIGPWPKAVPRGTGLIFRGAPGSTAEQPRSSRSCPSSTTYPQSQGLPRNAAGDRPVGRPGCGYTDRRIARRRYALVGYRVELRSGLARAEFKDHAPQRDTRPASTKVNNPLRTLRRPAPEMVTVCSPHRRGLVHRPDEHGVDRFRSAASWGRREHVGVLL